MKEKPDNLDKAQSEFRALRKNVRSLMLATLDESGMPRASYAPFVYHSRHYYIYVSHLSAHTRELLERPYASILLMEDEADATQIFARKRLSYECDCYEFDTTEPGHASILDLFNQRFGGVMDLLRSLPDFVLFRLSPRSGRFVTGFGQAYDLTGDELQHLLHVSAERIKAGKSGA